MTVGARLSQPRVRDPGHYPVGVINKTDLAPLVRADLGVMERDSRRMRGDGPFVFAQVLHGVGVRDVADHLMAAWRAATNVATGV